MHHVAFIGGNTCAGPRLGRPMSAAPTSTGTKYDPQRFVAMEAHCPAARLVPEAVGAHAACSIPSRPANHDHWRIKPMMHAKGRTRQPCCAHHAVDEPSTAHALFKGVQRRVAGRHTAVYSLGLLAGLMLVAVGCCHGCLNALSALEPWSACRAYRTTLAHNHGDDTRYTQE
jgi:hypothetical protein